MTHVTLVAKPLCRNLTAAALTALAVGAKAGYVPVGRNLPAGYTQVEYIESSGTQSIDLGIVGRVGLAVETDMLFVEVPANAAFCVAAGGPGETRFFPLWYAKTGWFVGCAAIGTLVEMTMVANAIYHVETVLRKGEQSMKVSDVDGKVLLDWTQDPASQDDFNSGATLGLFARRCLDGRIDCHSKARCYSLRIRQDDGHGGMTLVGDFVPCLNESGSAGLYDLVGKKFIPPDKPLAGYGRQIKCGFAVLLR